MLEMKLFTRRFDRVPMILSSRFLEFCVKLCQIWLFSSVFLFCPNALKGNKHVYIKTFVIANSGRNCAFSGKVPEGSNTFIRDCIDWEPRQRYDCGPVWTSHPLEASVLTPILQKKRIYKDERLPLWGHPSTPFNTCLCTFCWEWSTRRCGV